MVEVFKTNIKDQNVADKLIDQIHKTFIGYIANFDLQDCDNILRVKCMTRPIESDYLICFLKEFECSAEILEDEIVQTWAQNQ